MNPFFGVRVALSPEEKYLLSMAFGSSPQALCCAPATPSLLCGQLKAGELFHLTQKYGRFHLKRTADVEDAAERWVGLSQFDEADEGSLVAGLGSKRLLAHLLP